MRNSLLLAVALLGAAPAALAQSSLLKGTDLPGLDYSGKDLPADDPELCRKDCDSDPACRAYTYVRAGVQGPAARCYLKSDVPPAAANDCCVSGVKALPLAGTPAVSLPPMRPPASAADCDRDHDGVESPACGGADCDDNDPLRYAGHRERCDGTLADGRPAADHDEDCNPCTVAGLNPDGDADGDGVVSSRCTNPYILRSSAPAGCDPRQVHLYGAGFLVVGADCDDTRRAIIPGAQACVPGDPGAVRVCGERFRDQDLRDWETLRCPAGPGGEAGRCVAQPNGTGVCLP